MRVLPIEHRDRTIVRHDEFNPACSVTGRQALREARRSIVRSDHHSNLCEPFLSVIPVSGASISVLVPAMAQTTVCASDDTAARLDELQFDLGEGPCWESLSLRMPVLNSDLHEDDRTEWPIFRAAIYKTSVAGTDVGAMFAFPLYIGSLDIGAVDLYSDRPRTLSPVEVEDGKALAEVVTWQVLRRMLANYDGHELGDESAWSRREVHQATGMVLAQLDITAADATILLKAHAFTTGRSVREIANDVIDRRLIFTPEGSQ